MNETYLGNYRFPNRFRSLMLHLTKSKVLWKWFCSMNCLCVYLDKQWNWIPGWECERSSNICHWKDEREAMRKQTNVKINFFLTKKCSTVWIFLKVLKFFSPEGCYWKALMRKKCLSFVTDLYMDISGLERAAIGRSLENDPKDLPQQEVFRSQHSRALVGFLGAAPSQSCSYQDGCIQRARNVPPAIGHFWVNLSCTVLWEKEVNV